MMKFNFALASLIALSTSPFASAGGGFQIDDRKAGDYYYSTGHKNSPEDSHGEYTGEKYGGYKNSEKRARYYSGSKSSKSGKKDGSYHGGEKGEHYYHHHGSDKPDLTAIFHTELIDATIELFEMDPGTAKWVVDIDSVSDDLCPDETELTWHIHALALVDRDGDGFSNKAEDFEESMCITTGGHWDPTFACGPASDFSGTTCTGLMYDQSYSTRCTTNSTNGCEYGDISGKVGAIEIKTGTQEFIDSFIQTPVKKFYEDLSIVLHCGGAPRVACANFH